MNKFCSRCKQDVPVSAFSRNKSTKDGLSHNCKPCVKVYMAAHYRANREKILERTRTYHEENRDARLAVGKDYYERNRESIRAKAKDSRRESRYGVAPDRYAEMISAQEGRCAICLAVPDRPLSVDHCHSTGEVRSLLCFKCNAALGLMGDDVSRLLRAAEYLGRFQCPTG